MRIENCERLFRDVCFSPEGQELRSLIERHSDAMIHESLSGHPALAAVIPHLPLWLAEKLLNDHLMNAFGHMAKLEMDERGLQRVQGSGSVKHYEWLTVRKTSDLQMFQFPSQPVGA